MTRDSNEAETYLTHHPVRAGLLVVAELYIWVYVLDELFESLVPPPDGSLWPAAGAEGVLTDVWNVLALHQRRIPAHPLPNGPATRTARAAGEAQVRPCEQKCDCVTYC